VDESSNGKEAAEGGVKKERGRINEKERIAKLTRVIL
jgi:hypothetical protein